MVIDPADLRSFHSVTWLHRYRIGRMVGLSRTMAFLIAVRVLRYNV